MNKKTAIAVTIAVIIVGLFVGGTLMSGIFTSSNNNQAANASTTMQQTDQLQSNDVVVGTGDVAVAGKEVIVNYTGVFEATGKVFDSSVGKAPFTFTLGSGMVIKGWDIGVEGMKVGGKRVLVIPPQFAYGDKDYGPIPGGSTLIFQIELLGVK